MSMSSQHTLNFTHSASYEQIVYFVFLYHSAVPEGTPHATGNWLMRSRPMSLKQMLSAKLVARVSLYSMKMYSEQDLRLSVPSFWIRDNF